MHALGVDLEDWYVDVAHGSSRALAPARAALERQIDVLRALLDATSTRCTFFVLGTTALRYPSLVRALAAEGHEIAAHGHEHRRLDRMTWSERRDDLARAAATIGDVVGRAPLGYRAPYFSLDRVRDRERFYDLLRACGFRYSSSCRWAVRPTSFPEYSVGTLAGGGSWRVAPRALVVATIRRHERSGDPFSAYVHPHEFDPHALASTRTRERLWANLGRRSVPVTLDAVLRTFAFGKYSTRLPS